MSLFREGDRLHDDELEKNKPKQPHVSWLNPRRNE